MIFNITAEDILKSKVIEKPGWQHCVIADWADTQSQKGVGGVEVTYRVIDGPDKGVLAVDRFWENAPGFIVPFMEALAGGKKMEMKPQQLALTKDKMVGQYLDVEVRRGEWNGRPKNEVCNYKPFSGQKPAGDKPAGV